MDELEGQPEQLISFDVVVDGDITPPSASTVSST